MRLSSNQMKIVEKLAWFKHFRFYLNYLKDELFHKLVNVNLNYNNGHKHK